MFRSLLLSILAACSFGLQLSAQAPVKQITIHNETYYVYPFRISGNAEDIPPCGYALPDGKYIAYDVYHYKEVRSKHTQSFNIDGEVIGVQKLIDKDTANISVVFALKNNMPEGDARFYTKPLRAGSKASAFSTRWAYTGPYTTGLKHGEWRKQNRYGHETGHYNMGVLDGPYTYAYTDVDIQRPSETHYSQGVETGYALFKNRRGKLIERIHYNSLGIKDSMFYYFTNGNIRATEAYRPLPPTPTINRVYYLTVQNILNSRSREDMSYFKEVDEKGALVSLLQFKDSGSYVFDSLIFEKTLIKVRAVNCLPPQQLCYEVHHLPLKPELYGIEKEIEYYSNNFNYKSIGIYRRFSQRDTIVTVLNDTDSLSHRWQFHKNISVTPLGMRAKKHNGPLLLQMVTYKLPALGLTFDRFEFPGAFDSSLPTIDSIAGTVCFKDTLQIGQTNAHQVVTANLRKRTPMAMDEDFLNAQGAERKEEISISPTLSNTDMLFNLMENDLTFSKAPHRLLVNNKLYNGRVAYAHKHKPAFAKKDSVLLLPSESLLEYAIFFKGSYKNGYQHGDWEVTDVCKEGCKSPKEHFDKQKKYSRYLHGSYLNGLREGTFEEYELFTPTEYWEKQLYGKSPKRFLSKRVNYVNDTLQGPAFSNLRGGELYMTCSYNKGELDGEYVLYGDYGKTHVAHYSKGKLDGPYREYFEDKNQSLQTSAEFSNNKLQGLLEMYSKRKWLEIRADSGYLDYKKLFYDEGLLKEEIIMDDTHACRVTDYLTSSDVFMTYALIPHEQDETERVFRLRRYRYRLANEQTSGDSTNESHFSGSYKSYFLSGQLYCEGRIKAMKPEGAWNFYNESGTLIHRVDFRDSVIVAGGDSIPVLGKLTGYYYSKALRCEAFVTGVDVHYDCNTQKDLNAFETIIQNNYDYLGKENCVNGTGPVRQYNENGLLQATGQLLNYSKTGLWKYYDPTQKLNAMGYYVDNKRDGIWCEGDLEGINYEDAACFDPNDKNAKALFERNKKELRIRKTVYRKGQELSTDVYEADMNR